AKRSAAFKGKGGPSLLLQLKASPECEIHWHGLSLADGGLEFFRHKKIAECFRHFRTGRLVERHALYITEDIYRRDGKDHSTLQEYLLNLHHSFNEMLHSFFGERRFALFWKPLVHRTNLHLLSLTEIAVCLVERQRPER